MILCDEMNVPRVMPNKLGDRMAGQRKRKKMEFPVTKFIHQWPSQLDKTIIENSRWEVGSGVEDAPPGRLHGGTQVGLLFGQHNG